MINPITAALSETKGTVRYSEVAVTGPSDRTVWHGRAIRTDWPGARHCTAAVRARPDRVTGSHLAGRHRPPGLARRCRVPARARCAKRLPPPPLPMPFSFIKVTNEIFSRNFKFVEMHPTYSNPLRPLTLTPSDIPPPYL